VAPVTENTQVPLKIAGFDNVGVQSLEIRGVLAIGERLRITGVPTDVVTESVFPLQQIPGALNAYSALRIVDVPEAGPDGETRFPLMATVTDKAGNTSTADIVISVNRDEPPSVEAISLHREGFLPRDEVSFDITARDDVALRELRMSFTYTLATGQSRTVEEIYNPENGLIQAELVQQTVRIPLAGANAAAFDQTATVSVQAFDTNNQESNVFTAEIPVLADTRAPSVSVFEPIPGTTLYKGSTVTFRYRAIDDSYLSDVSFLINGAEIHTDNTEARLLEGEFAYEIPEDATALVMTVSALDAANKTFNEEIAYTLAEDAPPVITLRSPAPGTRLIEGEAFVANALVADNRGLDRVEIFIETQAGRTIVSTTDVNDTEEPLEGDTPQNRFFSASLRAPTQGGRVGVRAVDGAGLESTAYYELELLGDEEPPLVTLSEPTTTLERMPGESISVLGRADDNIYIDELTAVLIDSSGVEIPLNWRFFSRDDREIRITAPNPNTFGSVLAATRFSTDFSGDLTIPRDLIDRAGERFSLVVKARDRGDNTSTTQAVTVILLSDVEDPVIALVSPDATLVESESPRIQATITDNFELASYTVNGRLMSMKFGIYPL